MESLVMQEKRKASKVKKIGEKRIIGCGGCASKKKNFLDKIEEKGKV
jgi:hypothetical protein